MFKRSIIVENERDHYEGLDVGGRIILKCTLEG
jgi:hypothetical protein